MNSGALRHHVTLDVPNGTTGTYTPLTPPDWWCASRSEAVMGQLTLLGRAHPGITTATRVHLDGRTFHVDAIATPQDRVAELALTCHEVFD